MAKLISAEVALGALLETLVNPTLAKMKPFGGARAAEQDIANQMEAVAWLFNRYICQELPNLVALDWEDLCNKASNLQTRLTKFMRAGRSVVPLSLTTTEQKVKNACEAAKALRAPNNSSKNTFVTKVSVCLLNFRLDKCVLALGAATVGLWSFIEKEKHALCNGNGSCGELQYMPSDDDFAFKTVQEQTGIKADVLQIEECFSINDDLNRAGGSTKFFIMSCTGTFDLSPTVKLEKIAWISLDVAFSKARNSLIDSSGSSVHSTPAVQYFHLRPFCSSVEDWFTRQTLVKSLVQPNNVAKESLKDQDKTDLLVEKSGASNEEKSVTNQEQGLSKCTVDEMALEKSVKDKQRLSMMKTDVVALKLQLFAPTGSPQSQVGRKNNLTYAAEKEQKECVGAELCMSSGGGSTGAENTHCIQAQVVDKQRQSKPEVKTVGLNTKFDLAMENRTEILASRTGGTIKEFPMSAKVQEDCNAKQMDQNINAVAPDINMPSPNGSPQSSRKIKKREEELILEKAGALLSFKTAYRSVRKKRKDLCKELTDSMAQTDLLYKQIADCDSDLATLMGGGKAGLLLAIQLCESEGQKQTSSSKISIDQSQSDALLNRSRTIKTSQAGTSNKKRPFYMLKSAMQELNDVCTRNEWPLPSYGVFSSISKKRQCLYSGKVKIRGTDFELSETGEASETAKAAKLSAAAYMLSTLHLLKARSAML